MKRRTYNDTFNAKVDIVVSPDNIKNYSQERNDYTELALTAIKQKASVIKYISPSYKDYPILCDEAINQDFKTILLIEDSVSNYKQLGIKAIIKYPFLVSNLAKEIKYYYFFWELAISICYKVLWYIKEENKELFPLINKAIQQEPLAIFYVDSRISIYSKLCNIAYKQNKESIKYMDINYVDKYLVFEIVRNEPEKVRYLDRNKEYYKEAWKYAISLNGHLIKNINYSFIKDDLDYLFELIYIAEKSVPEVVNYPITLYTMCLENRKSKKRLISTPNILGNNIHMLLKEIDDEYEVLSKQYKEALIAEMKEKISLKSNSIPDCPIKVKTGKTKSIIN